MVVFGDSRGGSANFLTFENLLTYYTQTANKQGIESTAAALNKGLLSAKFKKGVSAFSFTNLPVSTFGSIASTTIFPSE